jgi:catechol 2,3-dioxygenase-like lactoylglutathione lyase family enzyme
VRIELLDHVALWIADRDAAEDFLVDSLAMHRIDRTDEFTLVGADARAGKLTLFEAPGPRDAGALAEVGLGVSSLDLALERLPTAALDRDLRVARLEGPEGLGLALVERAIGIDYDIAHVTLRVADVEDARAALATLGFSRDGDVLRVGSTDVLLVPGAPDGSARPLLNHLGLKVESAEMHLAEARERGLDVEDVVDAPNTIAVFVQGPGGLRLEYVEHKPSFSLS